MKSPSFFRSLRHAWRGLVLGWKTERNFRVHIVAAILVIFACLFFPLSKVERLVLLIVVMFVLVLELLNSCVERVVDLLKPRLDEYVKDVKDLMAGAVLIASLFALMIALIIFWPLFFSLMKFV